MKQQMKIFTIFSFTLQTVLALTLVLAMLLVTALTTTVVHAAEKELKKSRDTTQEAGVEKSKKIPRKARAAALEKAKTEAENRDSKAEARLIDIYKLIGQAKTREALPLAESLVRDNPNFQLAQLVYGDLLTAQLGSVRNLGNVPESTAKEAAPQLAGLRRESQLRLQALRERPAAGLIPSQFTLLSGQNKHAIAVDAGKSRLYLFENSPTGMKLLADFYISVGKSGTGKTTEGDLRTPLGVYFVTSNLDPKSLKALYGSGALPINYPNQLDVKRGKTGSGIWLHGTPSAQFSRAPLDTDGCVVLANPDLSRIIKTVQVRTTPVVIAQSLEWIAPLTAKADSKNFEDALTAWSTAKSNGDMARLMAWYAPDFSSDGKSLAEFTPAVQLELKQLGGRSVQLQDLSYLRWLDSNDTMVVSFRELAQGAKSGPNKRQYWTRQGSKWKIFFESTIL